MDIKVCTKKICTIIFTLSISNIAFSMPIAHLYLDSEQGDYIGQGRTFDINYTPDNSDHFLAYLTGPATSEPTYLTFILGTVTSGFDNTYAILNFGTNQLDIPIQAGDYLDAERAPFASLGHPGLDISFQNRGCNRVKGNFSVITTVFSDKAQEATGSKIETFSASFEQHCEGHEPALFGEFYYDAFGRAQGVSEPSVFALLSIGFLGLLFSNRRRKQ
jgi:hypothetical protein